MGAEFIARSKSMGAAPGSRDVKFAISLDTSAKRAIRSRRLHDPSQFACLVVGSLPSAGEELCPRDRGIPIVKRQVGSELWIEGNGRREAGLR